MVASLMFVACGGGATESATEGETSTSMSTSTSTSMSTSTATPTSTSTSSSGTAGESESSGTTAGTTSGEPNSCTQLCERSLECGVDVTLAACIADCGALDPLLQSCLLACDPSVCGDFLMCTTQCAFPGDPAAPPYASCDGVGQCQPGVLVCISTKDFDNNLEYSVCAPYCDKNAECPVPETGTAPARCDLEVRPAVCSLDCSEGQQCPDDMVCAQGLCTWLLP